MAEGDGRVGCPSVGKAQALVQWNWVQIPPPDLGRDLPPSEAGVPLAPEGCALQPARRPFVASASRPWTENSQNTARSSSPATGV